MTYIPLHGLANNCFNAHVFISKLSQNSPTSPIKSSVLIIITPSIKRCRLLNLIHTRHQNKTKLSPNTAHLIEKLNMQRKNYICINRHPSLELTQSYSIWPNINRRFLSNLCQSKCSQNKRNAVQGRNSA